MRSMFGYVLSRVLVLGCLLLLGLVLVAGRASADDNRCILGPGSLLKGGTDLGTGCYSCGLCLNHAAASSCLNGLGDEVAIPINSWASLRLSTLGSTGTFTANVRTSLPGHDAGGAGNEVFTDVSTADGTGIAEGVYGHIWGEVDSCTTCSVNMSVIVCPR